jgi:glyoxylase-like metal-dependent hydrolase (beta-lactamase superfamily II)
MAALATIIIVSPLVTLGQGRLGIDFTPKLIPIVENIYAYEGPLELPGQEEIVRTNSLVIVTDEGVVVADGQDNPEEGRRMLRAIREVTDQPVRYLINASPHGDHVNSNGVFEDAVIIAHSNTRDAVAASLERATGDAPRPTLPHVTFDDEMVLHVGGKTIELYYFGLGHTRGDTVVYLPEEGVAFLTELYFNGIAASLSEGYAGEHLNTLRRALELDAEWFIPGHGFIDGNDADELRAGAERYYDNVKAIHDAVLKHVEAGDSLEKTLEEIEGDLGEFAELPFFGFLKQGCISGTYRALSENR